MTGRCSPRALVTLTPLLSLLSQDQQDWPLLTLGPRSCSRLDDDTARVRFRLGCVSVSSRQAFSLHSQARG